MTEDVVLSEKIKSVIEGLHPKPSQISFAIINLKSAEPKIAGFNIDQLIYPASIYKVFVAAEVLRQVDSNQRKLEDLVEVIVNVDDIRLFPKDTKKDHRHLLKIHEKVTLDYLLDLMLTRSDNVASNTLVNLVGWKNISNFIVSNGWQESAVSQEHLDDLKEEGDSRISSITVSSARHLAELFYKIETNTLVNSRVSGRLKEYMAKGSEDRKGGLFLPEFKTYYQKGGSLKINGYKYNFLKSIFRLFMPNRYVITRYRGEAGLIEANNVCYAIAVLTQIKTKWPWKKFGVKEFSEKIFTMMGKSVK